MTRGDWLFPFNLKALRWHTAPHRWAWRWTRDLSREMRLLNAQRFIRESTHD